MHPIEKKLQFKEGSCLLILNLPEPLAELVEAWSLVSVFQEKLPEDVNQADAMLVFVKKEEDVKAAAEVVNHHLPQDGLLWFSYPKKTSKRYTSEVTRDHGWEALTDIGLRPVRQVAIDDDWSALRWRPDPKA
ncbi:hypothetical protein [Salisediminibacterium selenitireducens]|uniref:DUF3052 domain-containing protein n=1 Tax=Bacillus selenitireducens (strain ATCC 700615 / DSM 15326 / MLS10) TaxID=439292 RepID=D6XYS9_BACIE|nr:hypothetical protein [Salisediminibacterium selenitireducens]ADH98237.1 conserved hypothetical protein [[Bacillus] selenitireducens MLS10]